MRPSAWRRRRVTLAALVGAIGLAAIAVLAPDLTAGRSPETLEAAVTTAMDGPCLLPAPDMRRQHKSLLFNERTMVVRHGQRDPDASLNRCVTCHATFNAAGMAISYDDERHFCSSCHAEVAVKLDCFSCHRSTPDTDTHAGGAS